MNPATPEKPPAPRRANPLIPGGWIALVVLLIFMTGVLWYDSNREITYTDFTTLMDQGQIKSLVLVGPDKATGEIRDKDSELAHKLKLTSGKFQVALPTSLDQTPFLRELRQKDEAKINEYAAAHKDQPRPEPVTISKRDDPTWLGPVLVNVILVIGLLAVFFFFLPRMRDPMSGGFLNNYIRSPAKRYEKGKGRVTFEDVAGMETAKRELQEIVDYLRDSTKFTRLGAQVPKGVLLVGPPGTGKTLLAKAVAGEANVPFFSISGSEFIQMFVGVGASRVRDMFKNAKENSPCLIFIDEIDAVGRMRGAGVGGGADEREQTLNQILSEMDGFQPSETIIVMAATNRPDVLDSALLRPGRFDRHVTVDRPTWKGRLEIIKVHTRNKPLADDVDLERVARNMVGMSGADLRNLCNEAALLATRAGKNKLEQVDFDRAADRVRLGATREEKYSEEEKRRTAVHEAGHALAAWLNPKADKIDRVSIIPRGQTGGVTLFQPDEERMDRSLSELQARLVMCMGGRAADKLVFGEPLSGAIGDLKQATRIARMMVAQFGMSERLGPVWYRFGEEHVFLGKELHEGRDFSEGTARIIDEEIQRILVEAEASASHLMREHRDKLDLLTDALLIHEELDAKQVDMVFRGLTLPPPTIDAKPKPQPPVTTTEQAAEASTEPGPPPRVAFGGA